MCVHGAFNRNLMYDDEILHEYIDMLTFYLNRSLVHWNI